ncbi:MAG TPA: hypothetical protein VF733_06435 [Candidatus Saccharimonadales bacterium]
MIPTLPFDANTPGAKRFSLKKRHILIILLSLFALIALFKLPYEGNIIKSHDLKRVDKILKEKYEVDRSYHLGSAQDCAVSGPTTFGEFTGVHICHITFAKAYYPRVEIKPATGMDYEYVYNPKTRDYDGIPGETFQYESIQYLGKDIFDYMHESDRPRSLKVVELEDRLSLGRLDRLYFGDVWPAHNIETPKSLVGRFIWHNPADSQLLPPPVEKLANDITQHVKADEPLTKGAPSVSEALKEGRAPLVVFFELEYCHSPPIILLDKFCMMPKF